MVVSSADLEAASTNTTQLTIQDAHVYPNPFDNEKEVTTFKIKIYSKDAINEMSLSIIIYDFNGKKVWTKKVSLPAKAAGEMELAPIGWGGDNDMAKKVANGLYFAKVIIEGTNTKAKVIKIMVK